MPKQTSGFVLVLTTIIIAASVLLVSLVVNRVNAYRHASSLWPTIEKARLLALSGVAIAMSQITELDLKEQAQKEDQETKQMDQKSQSSDKSDKDKQEQQAIATLLALNSWQSFTFTQAAEGIDGECTLYISSEEGKINLNTLYDFKKKAWLQAGPVDGKKISQFLTESLKIVPERAQQESIIERPAAGGATALSWEALLETFFKQRSYPVNDVSELLALPQLARSSLPLFPDPEDSKKISLTDLFTVSSSTTTLDPLLFSAAVQRSLGLHKKGLKELEKGGTQELIKLLRAPRINWESQWKPALATLYGKEYTALPEPIKPLLSTRFEPKTFSVVSYGKVGSVVQKVCAIIERNKDSAQEKQSSKPQPFLYKKLYWL
jgi:hypothetical protein